MTLSIISLCIFAQLCQVTGQLLMKHAMIKTNLPPIPWLQVLWRFGLGLTALVVWFFLWAGLLQKKDLSYIYPFEGICPVLILIFAWMLLKEKSSPQSWLGIGLITIGIVLVAAS